MSGLTKRNNVIPSEAKNLSSAETQERFLTPQTPFEMTKRMLLCALGRRFLPNEVQEQLRVQ
jgi:hypothetical protein